MNKLIAVLILIAAAGAPAATFTPQATAIPGSAPQGFNYQGRLEDNGFPVNGTKQMVFRLYTADPGGVLLWTSPAQSVSVSLGLFNAVVPVPITALVGGGSRYLEAQIDGTVMSPRELLNSVPYALIAKSVEGTIDVSTAGLAVNANGSATQPALYISSVSGNVGVGTSSPGAAFDVGGTAAFGDAASKSTFTAAGALLTQNVSIGTGTAGTLPLHVVQAAGATNLAHFENTGSANVLEINARGGLNHVFNQIDGRFGLEPDAASGFGVINHDYAGLALGSSGLYSAITTGGSGVDGGVRQMFFWTNNNFSSPRMTIASGGNVGVGTSNPGTLFHVSSGVVTIDGNATTALTTVGRVGVGTSSPGAKLHVSSGAVLVDGDATNPFQVGASSFVINSSGNVGIGTAAPKLGQPPAKTLQLGNNMIFQNVIGSQSMFSNNAYYDGTWKRATAATVQGLRFNHLVGGLTFHVSPTGAADSTIANWDTTDVKFAIGSNGNVGIGTGGSANPNDLLEVAGGNVRLTAVAGSAGSVKLFPVLTVGAVTCATQCGANAVCLGAWTSAGVVSTCATATASNRCLCSGFGD